MSLGRAKLAIGQGISVWVLEAMEGFGAAQIHTHHAIQITASLSGSLKLIDSREELQAPCLAVAADAPHRLDAQGLLVFIFVEPESPAGRALNAKLFGQAPLVQLDTSTVIDVLAPLRSTFEESVSLSRLLAIGQDAIEALASFERASLPDPRILRVIERISVNNDEALDDVAKAAGVYLSPSRLRHLFVEQTGLPFRTYVLWLKLVRALEIYSEGQSLTEAAHAAGFADSAHFSRTFRRTFGLPATTLSRV